MILRTLKITQFKSHEWQQLEFSPLFNCFTGLNGTGKTNILDAIHFLCLTKSHQNVADAQLVKHGTTLFRLEGTFEKQQKKEKIVAKYQESGKKVMERNDNAITRLADHVGQFPVVFIAPDDVQLLLEGSEHRRRLLDTTLSQTDALYLQHLITYTQLLKQRNSALKQFAENRRYDALLLEAIDQQMYVPAQYIHAQRSAFCLTFLPVFQSYYAAISGGKEQVMLQYSSPLEHTDCATLFLHNLEKDKILQRTTSGIHRDDIEITMSDHLIKKYGSQGQLKSCLLALRLAQYELLKTTMKTNPILLLDDIFDKLDKERVRQLIGLLVERNFGQIFITDTQKDRIAPILEGFSDDFRLFEL